MRSDYQFYLEESIEHTSEIATLVNEYDGVSGVINCIESIKNKLLYIQKSALRIEDIQDIRERIFSILDYLGVCKKRNELEFARLLVISNLLVLGSFISKKIRLITTDSSHENL